METNKTDNVMKDFRDHSLLPYNTFGIDVKCRRFVEFDSVDELLGVLPTLRGQDSRALLIIGGGSNLLLTKNFDGTAIHSAIKGMDKVSEDGSHVLLRCGSGETWDDVVAHCVDNGWHGAENLSLIPGEVGASAVQNIGAYGVEAKDLIYKVEAVDIVSGQMVEFANADCRYAYRQSRFKQEWRGRYVITHVAYRLAKTFVPSLGYGNIRQTLAAKGIDTPTAAQLRRVIIGIRETKLPDTKVLGNAGSFFMNPMVGHDVAERLLAKYPDMPHYDAGEGRIKIPAGWLIEQCGWKGASMGRAGVYERQALVIVNRGGATGEEIVALYKRIMHDVKERFGVEIHPEVNVI